jgi:hypothetical protein
MANRLLGHVGTFWDCLGFEVPHAFNIAFVHGAVLE